MLVITPFDSLVVVATSKQEELHCKIKLRETWEPKAFSHASLFHYHCRTRAQRNQQSTGDLESFRQSSLKSHYPLIDRIDPNNTDEFRNQTLCAGEGAEVW